MNTENTIEEIGPEKHTVGFDETLTVKRANDTFFVVKSGGRLVIEQSQNCKIFFEASSTVELKNDTGSIKQEV